MNTGSLLFNSSYIGYFKLLLQVENQNWRDLLLNILMVQTMCAKHIKSQSPIILLLFKAVCLLQRRHHSKLNVRNEFKQVIVDIHMVTSTVAKHFQNGKELGIDMFDNLPKSLVVPINARDV